MKNLIMNYFDKTELVTNIEEAISFINSLKGITANKYSISVLKDFFNLGGSKIQNIWKQGKCFEIATTGCGKSRINCYKPLASTLLKHNEIVKKNKEETLEKEKKQKQKREQEFLSLMYEHLKGWYIVTITGNAFKIHGNDGNVTKSVKVFSENRIEAYNKAIKHLEENPPKNVSFWTYFESSESALIEFVGVWTDELEIECT